MQLQNQRETKNTQMGESGLQSPMCIKSLSFDDVQCLQMFTRETWGWAILIFLKPTMLKLFPMLPRNFGQTLGFPSGVGGPLYQPSVSLPPWAIFLEGVHPSKRKNDHQHWCNKIVRIFVLKLFPG